jgi:hypothetical protein
MAVLKTVDYKLKSDPNKIFKIPQESLKQTEHIMKHILKSKDLAELADIVNNHNYFGNVSIFTRNDLLSTAREILNSRPGTIESFRYQDQFYIKAGSYEAFRIKEEAKELNETLTDALDRLECREERMN